MIDDMDLFDKIKFALMTNFMLHDVTAACFGKDIKELLPTESITDLTENPEAAVNLLNAANSFVVMSNPLCFSVIAGDRRIGIPIKKSSEPIVELLTEIQKKRYSETE